MQRNTDKTYTATKEIEGVTYRAQFNGVREATRASFKYRNDELGLREYLLSNVIVDPPGLKLDDFDTLDEATEVSNFAASVMTGRFRNDQQQGASKEASETKLDAVAADPK